MLLDACASMRMDQKIGQVGVTLEVNLRIIQVRMHVQPWL